mgnify:CR=1 FL=1
MDKKMLLIDGHGLAFRGFYALPETLTAADGTPTNAIVGFTNMLMKCIDDMEIENVAMFFDPKGPNVIAYGKFIQSVIDFIIVAFAIFMGVKAINRLKREEAVAPSVPPLPSKEEELLGEIRDLLKVQNNRP